MLARPRFLVVLVVAAVFVGVVHGERARGDELQDVADSGEDGRRDEDRSARPCLSIRCAGDDQTVSGQEENDDREAEFGRDLGAADDDEGLAAVDELEVVVLRQQGEQHLALRWQRTPDDCSDER